MIRINLLPVRQRRKLEAARRELFIALFGGVLVLFACLAGWGGLQVRHAALRAEVVALQKEVERLGVEVTQVDALEKFRDDLQRKLSVIDGLRRRKTGPVHMLDDLAIATPERLFLESVSERDGAIQIVGFAVSNELISQFLRQLDASPYFDAVFLQNIEAVNAKSDASVALRKFDITARTSSPAEEAAKAAAEAAPSAGAPGAPPAGAPAAAGAAPGSPAATPAPAAPAGTPPPAPPATPAGGDAAGDE